MMWLVTIQNQPSVNAHKKNWIYLFIASSLPSKYLPIYLLVITYAYIGIEQLPTLT